MFAHQILIAAVTLLSLQLVNVKNTEAVNFSTDKIFSVATGDWNSDDAPDTVIILNVDEGKQFDVLFYLSDEYRRLKLHDYVQDMIWGASVMFGQEPWVSVRENGSIIIGSQNSAIGRNRWEQKLTITYRQSQFIIAGFTYSYYDTLDLNANGECDLNLMTGKGFVNGEAVRVPKQKLSVEKFTNQSDAILEICAIQ